LLDRQSDHVRRVAILACCYRIDLVTHIPRDPDRAVCFGTQVQLPSRGAGGLFVASIFSGL
jgi:hypothetical protein